MSHGSIFNTTISLDIDGRHIGHIMIPHQRLDASMCFLMTPIVSIKNGKGPTLYLNSGTHGDEYEGPIALRRLIHSLKPEDIQGQVIITPSLNLPAVEASQRQSSVDGQDLNRSFPGNVHGSLSDRIASFVSDEILPRADAVVDVHAAPVQELRDA